MTKSVTTPKLTLVKAFLCTVKLGNFKINGGRLRGKKRYLRRLNLTTGSVFPYERARNPNVTIHRTTRDASCFLNFRNSIEC